MIAIDDDGVRAFGNNGAIPDRSISPLERDAGRMSADSTQGFHDLTLDRLTKVGSDPDHSEAAAPSAAAAATMRAIRLAKASSSGRCPFRYRW